MTAAVLLGGTLFGGCGGGGGGPTDPGTPGAPGTTGSQTSSTTGGSTAASSSSKAGGSAGGSTVTPGVSTGTPGSSAVPGATAPAGTAPASAPAAAPGTASAAAPAAGATGAPAAAAPAAAASNPTGTIIPLYSAPAAGTWAAVEAAKRAHPAVPVLAVINPANGPGTAALSDYMTGIAQLTAAGVKVIGYVHTSYGQRAAADVQADVDRWHSLFQGVSGIFFDEMANTPGFEGYYQGLTAYAKGHGFDFTIGNPGADGSASYVGSVDVILVYENRGLPALATLGGWHTAYDRHNFGIIPYAVPSLDAGFVKAAAQSCGYIYVDNDDLPNPWDTVPPYLDTLVGALG